MPQSLSSRPSSQGREGRAGGFRDDLGTRRQSDLLVGRRGRRGSAARHLAALRRPRDPQRSLSARAGRRQEYRTQGTGAAEPSEQAAGIPDPRDRCSRAQRAGGRNTGPKGPVQPSPASRRQEYRTQGTGAAEPSEQAAGIPDPRDRCSRAQRAGGRNTGPKGPVQPSPASRRQEYRTQGTGAAEPSEQAAGMPGTSASRWTRGGGCARRWADGWRTSCRSLPCHRRRGPGP